MAQLGFQGEVVSHLEHGVAGEVTVGVVGPDATGGAQAGIVGDGGGEDGEQEEEAEQSRAISVADAAPGDLTLGTKIFKATGRSGVPVFIAPCEIQRDGQAARGGGTTALQERSGMGFQGFLLLEEDDDEDPVAQRKKWFKEMRGWLMVLATLVASVTYQAGLNPPGGFWQDDADGHHAGDPVLRDRHWSKYMIFYYLNATAFVTSLVIMVLLMSERFYHTESKVVALMFTTFVDLISLVGAYIASTRTTGFFSSCICIVIIACISFVGIVTFGEYVVHTTYDHLYTCPN
ncbi:hypothetical protein U9M48_028906 [Paspalum notatum var. saurae]|uniref:PGG domain-containing protein n=1 Tax=Paspalum notatum var. saurae TaxID=547442 RepID=A0AAQ3TXC1_PASNO